jgi:formylglycine-generating enzyme required for sulfatase activity
MTTRQLSGFTALTSHNSLCLFNGFRSLTTLSALAACAAALALAPTARAQSCAGDLNGDGMVNGADLGVVLANWGFCPPGITQVTPLQGSTLGGTVISITGSGLSGVTAVSIGGAPCTAVTVLSPTLVRVTTPPGVVGQAAISVTAPTGTTLAPIPFTYVMQQVSSIVPNTGSYTGGTAITITGTYLAATTGVTIGGVPATNVVAVSATQVTAVTPAGSVGAVDVVITGTKGVLTVAGGFTYQSIIVPTWATLVEAMPDPAVVTNSTLRAAITASGLAWRVRDTATQMEMLLVPAGTFTMGCTASNQYGCNGDENPTHSVTLTQAFYLGRYEVTQGQWVARMGSNPSYFAGQSDSANRPVEQVSWNTIQGYLSATGMRLPSEAEWEYACRAGTTAAFNNGSSDDATVGTIAWYSSNSGSQTHAVGGKAANALGLYDMSGNVYEWVNDWYGSTYYSVSPSTNPLGPVSGSTRVLRGGAWGNLTDIVRSSCRIVNTPDFTYGGLGFRVARAP